jgi:hypothetical protein
MQNKSKPDNYLNIKRSTALILVLFCSSFLYSFGGNAFSPQNDSSIEQLYNKSKFKKWFDFWKEQIPELKNFKIETTNTVSNIHSDKINLKNWIKERNSREFTPNYSPDKNYLIDKYFFVGFEQKGDTIFETSGDIDPSFVLINLNTSALEYFTLGTYSFFDESIWTSDSICYLTGFSFDDSKQNIPEAFS